MKMDGIPTLWGVLGVPDLGTKRLARQRRECLMFLIGVMEMNVDGKEETFTHVGEESFQEKMTKKTLAKKMREVKKQMVQIVAEEYNGFNFKVPKNTVKVVTLLLVQPGVLGRKDG